MANEPFITLLIKGQSDQISKIKEAFIGINVDGEQVIRYGNLVEYPSDEELEKIPIEAVDDMSEQEINELKKEKWFYDEWRVSPEKIVYEVLQADNYLKIEYRERYAAPIRLIKYISKLNLDLFFYVAENDIFSSVSRNYFGMGGIFYCYNIPPMEFDNEQRPVYENDENQMIYLSNDQRVPSNLFYGYSRWNPIKYIVNAILFEPTRWNMTEPPLYDQEMEDKKIAEYFERSIPDEDEEVDEDLNDLFGE
jgi:hypothetical protein